MGRRASLSVAEQRRGKGIETGRGAAADSGPDVTSSLRRPLARARPRRFRYAAKRVNRSPRERSSSSRFSTKSPGESSREAFHLATGPRSSAICIGTD